MIISYRKGNKIFKFCEPNKNSNNIFSVIVGKNGTGKSRLLNEIIGNFLPETFVKRRSEFKSSELEYTNHPKKIIAVSTSPYDKFPIIRSYLNKAQGLNIYSYVGIRDLKTLDFSLGFMSKIISQLLYTKYNDHNQFNKIIEVLHYLGYSDEIFLKFDIKLNTKATKDLLSSSNIEEEFKYILSQPGIMRPNLSFFLDVTNHGDEEDKIDKNKLYNFLDILHYYNFGQRRIFDVVLDKNHISSEIRIEDLFFLMEAGIAKLRDVSLKKLDTGKIYEISEASSGEQCIFTTLIGISCNIEDNSLILIDEPEISLHPEWQEKYITLLIETFKKYRNCHFIIATHSPQLISKLSTENCYILKMDNKELKNAKDYANNSIDFQLANIFNAPDLKTNI